MSRTTGRTMELLGLLSTGRMWNARELREKLEVSARTLRRDIADLRGLGYGIEARPGVGGGYRRGAGARIPPLLLTEDEALAIGIGLRMAAAAGIADTAELAARALAKLSTILPSAAREQIDLVAGALMHLSGPADPVELPVLATLARAIRDRRRLRIEYVRADGAHRRRVIEPERIVRSVAHWYVIAWVADAAQWRTFRLDRMQLSLPLRAPFPHREIDDDQLLRFTSWAVAVAPYPVRTAVRMQAPPEQLRRHFGAESVRMIDLHDGTTRVEAGASTAETLREWLSVPGVAWEHIEGAVV